MSKEEIEELLNNYNSTEKTIEDLKKQNKDREKQINELFKPVIEKANMLFVEYLSIGVCGSFGVRTIQILLSRYKQGERTYALYKELKELE